MVGEAGLQAARINEIRQRFVCQIGIDGAGPVADEAREMVDLARFPGLDNQACQRSSALSEQMVVDGTDREEHGERCRRR